MESVGLMDNGFITALAVIAIAVMLLIAMVSDEITF
jgi:cell division protein FtsX